jgi:hypothetical protein
MAGPLPSVSARINWELVVAAEVGVNRLQPAPSSSVRMMLTNRMTDRCVARAVFGVEMDLFMIFLASSSINRGCRAWTLWVDRRQN